jgi:hypothetical protein
MTAEVTFSRQPPQFDELEAECLEVGDVAVQRGPVGHRTHEQGVHAGVHAPERLEDRGQNGRDPARDPEGVLSVHVGLPLRRTACTPMVGSSG